MQYAPAHSPHQRRSRGGRQPAKEKGKREKGEEKRRKEKKSQAQTEAGDNTKSIQLTAGKREKGKQGATTSSVGYVVRRKRDLGRPTRFYSSVRTPFLPPPRRFPASYFPFFLVPLSQVIPFYVAESQMLSSLDRLLDQVRKPFDRLVACRSSVCVCFAFYSCCIDGQTEGGKNNRASVQT